MGMKIDWRTLVGHARNHLTLASTRSLSLHYLEVAGDSIVYRQLFFLLVF